MEKEAVLSGKKRFKNIYSFIHSFICAWGQRRNYFSKPRIEEEEKTSRAPEQVDQWNLNCGYIHSQKQEKYSREEKQIFY